MAGYIAENMNAGVPENYSGWALGDAKVRQLRNEVVTSLQKAVADTNNPDTRDAAEATLKRELAEAKLTVTQARKFYESAQEQLRERVQNQRAAMRRNEPVPSQESLDEIKTAETMQEMAQERIQALEEYGKVLTVASHRNTPYFTGTHATLRERMPEQTPAILDSQVGKLTQAASVETAVKLVPKDPQEWNPAAERATGKTADFVKASLALDDLDRQTVQTHTRSVRGGAFAVECHQAMTVEQRGVSQTWQQTCRGARATVADEHGFPGMAGADHANRLGIPALPATRTDGAEQSGASVAEQQKAMVTQAATIRRTGAVPIYSPQAQVETGTAEWDR